MHASYKPSLHSVQALSRDNSSPAIFRTGRASSREMRVPKYPFCSCCRGTGVCSLAMDDCIVRAVGSCLVSFGRPVHRLDAGSTWGERADVATHRFCTTFFLNLSFFFGFLFVFCQVMTLCHYFRFTVDVRVCGIDTSELNAACGLTSQMRIF